jgi:aldehyde:ferredoxin oxidoreductase
MMNKKDREAAIAELNYPEAPKLVTNYPGPKSKAIFDECMFMESPQRTAGLLFPIAIDEARGACFKDVDGNIFIDACSSIAVSAVGHNHPKVVKAIQEQAAKFGHGFDLSNPVKTKLLKEMIQTAPPVLKNSSFITLGMSGTAAAEMAIKQAKMITGRSDICAFEGAYHGVFGTANAMTTGSAYRTDYGPLMPGVHHLPYPYCYRCSFNLEYPKCDMQCAKFVDYQLNTPYTGKNNIAAIVAEGMQGEGGYVAPPKEWWPMMRKIADDHGCLLIADEVQSGFGKSGKLWAMEHFDCEPDIMTFGKAVGGDQPVAGIFTKGRYWSKLVPGSQPVTFASNAISMAAALANYEIMLDPELNLMGRAEELGHEFQSMLKEAQKTNEIIGEIRGLGLLQGIELVKNPETKEPVDGQKLLNVLVEDFAPRGIWVAPAGRYGNVLRFMPPLTMRHDHFTWCVETIIEVLNEKKDELSGSGSRKKPMSHHFQTVDSEPEFVTTGGEVQSKFLRVDMNTQSVSAEQIPESYTMLGGRGLTSAMINAEVQATCDPLGPSNKLVFAPGLLTGTSLVNTGRISVGAKSPLTGGIKESNAGGAIAVAVANAGLAAIIIEGQAPSNTLYILKIDKEGNADLLPADEYQGDRTYALVEKLQQKYGEKNAIVCIGPAGEYHLDSASIQTTDVDGRPCRAAARGGLGAVMGSKGLKAIIVELSGKKARKPADPESFKSASRVFAKLIKEDPGTEMLTEMGTAGLVSAINTMGAFPSLNATKGVFEGWEKISGETMTETIRQRKGKTTHLGCSQCIIRCSNEYVNAEGGYMTSSLEYETIWAMGGMTGIDDLDTIAQLDFLSDDIGVDTMNTGVAIGVAMDAGHKQFGDGPAAIDMMNEIGEGTDFGKILGNGPDAVGKYFNHARVPTVKRQSIAAYDPRIMQANGVTYATSPMGADHTAGNLIGEYAAGTLDLASPDGQVEASRFTQIGVAAVDSLGLCLFVGAILSQPEAMESLLQMINAQLGSQLGPESIPTMGLTALSAEREFNRKAGLTREDDRLPQFFYDEPLPPHNVKFSISDEDLDTTLGYCC